MKLNELDIFQSRTAYKPFDYPWAFQTYDEHAHKDHWSPTEIAMDEDKYDWDNKITDGEKAFLVQVFRLFTQGDVQVARA